MSALRALKSICQAFEFEIDQERKPLHEIVQVFFPVLEGLLGSSEVMNSPNYVQMMILISKIFFICNQVSTAQSKRTNK